MFDDDSIAGSWPPHLQRLEPIDALARRPLDLDRCAGLHDAEHKPLSLLGKGISPVREADVLVGRSTIDSGALLLTVHVFSHCVWTLALEQRTPSPGAVGSWASSAGPRRRGASVDYPAAVT